MPQIRPRDLLSEGLLGRLGGTSREATALAEQVLGAGTTASSTAAGAQAPGAGLPPDADMAATLRRDIARLADAGYLKVALPQEFGGLGCTLRQAACGQRRLARNAPLTALAVSAHLYWTGAAADAYRAGDNSARWMLLEASRGALFAAGHGAVTAGGDLRFADPRSRCEPAGESGYRFRDPTVLSSLTPAWDWVAVHAIRPVGGARPAGADAVLAFAGRGSRCTPAFRVARVMPGGAPGDAFTASATGWGHSILASVQYSDARRAFNQAVAAVAGRPWAPGPDEDDDDERPYQGERSERDEQGGRDEHPGGHPLDAWAAAEAGLRLDAMKERIARITHPWPLIPDQSPDLGGQRLISIYAMRHEVAEGAALVRDLLTQFPAPAPAAPFPR